MSDATAAAGLRPLESDALAPARVAHRWRSIGRFLGIAAQLGLLLALLDLLEIEPRSGLLRILPLVFAGFLAHSALPLRSRPAFFLLLSFAAFAIVLGPGPGAMLIVLGLGLFSLCHLPIAFRARVLLILIAGIALAALRAGWVPAAGIEPLPGAVLPVLGSMFMFRTIIYLYDLRHEERARHSGGPGSAAPVSIWARLSYFFLLPNVCFLLFPVVDYRTFRRTWYDTEAAVIYQKGVWWISLGLAYLLFYRVVYHYLVLAPEQVKGLRALLRFMVSSYLVYVRVVGQFHLIIGLLCLFGFNLPPANRFYLLASSFTDFWRRARIDWKDFMVKTLYFPTLVPLQRRWGTTPALIAATAVVFAATWLLHSYQWFWLRGDFPLSQADAVFWGTFGSCVLVNSVLEARHARKRATAALTPGAATMRAVKVLGMFLFLSALWSYWNISSPSDWLWVLSSAGASRPVAWLELLGVFAIAVGLGVGAQLLLARAAARQGSPVRGGRNPALRQPLLGAPWQPAGVAAVALVLVGVLAAARGVFGSSVMQVASTLSTNGLNAADQMREDRGYYETLLDTRRPIAGLQVEAGRTAAKVPYLPITRMRFVRSTYDLLDYELIPSFRGGIFRGLPFETNGWGMRDREYALKPPPNTYRIAILGASYEMGASVRVEDRFEWLLEDRLNREGPGAPRRHYEILNYSVGGYSLVQDLVVAERKTFRFAPNVVIVGIRANDTSVALGHMVRVVSRRYVIAYPEIRKKLRDAGVQPGMSELKLRRVIAPIIPDLLRWSLARIARLCRANGARPVALVIPMTKAGPSDAQSIAKVAAWAEAAGFSVLSLEDVFVGQPLDSIRFAPPDAHPNVKGHRLMADRLYDVLRQTDGRVLNLGFATR